MIANKKEILESISGIVESMLDTKQYGTYGIYITMHEGCPVNITTVNETKLLRKPGGRVEISK